MDPFVSATDLAERIRLREVSPVEAVEVYLERMDRLDPALNAFCFRDDDRVQAEARAAEQRLATEPTEELPAFLGVPIPIKDLHPLAGWPTTYGSRGSSRDPSVLTDPVVRRLLDAGFIATGKTTAPEFGTISCTESAALGTTRNPWHTDHTPGGSSGGSAAALAAGLAPIAHGGDGGGSLRIPASCCGLVGLKPSRNRVTEPVQVIEGLATQGVLSRTVADTAALLDVLGRPDPAAWHNAPPAARPYAEVASQRPPRLRVAVMTAPPMDLAVDRSCVDAVERTAAALESLGHHVEPANLDFPGIDELTLDFGLIWNTGSALYPLEDWDAIEPLNAALRAAAGATDSLTYVQAVARIQLQLRPVVQRFGSEIDLLLTPTMAVEPPRCGTVWEGADVEPLMPLLNSFPMAIFTSLWNVTGQPAISLPVHQAPSGLPVGVQLVGPPWRDDLVLQVGAELEEALPWVDRHPALART